MLALTYVEHDCERHMLSLAYCTLHDAEGCMDCRTLAGLDLPQACREVIDKDANAVLDEVEAAIYLVASTILRGEGFSYDIPSRAKGNQVGCIYCGFNCSAAQHSSSLCQLTAVSHSQPQRCLFSQAALVLLVHFSFAVTSDMKYHEQALCRGAALCA
jgi:hypothetical protein